MAATLDAEKENINAAMLQECTNLVRKMGTTLKVDPSEKAVEVNKYTVVYCTYAVSTRKLELVTVEVTEAYMGSILGKDKRKKTEEVRCATREEVVSHSITVLRSERIAVLPTYREQETFT